MALGRKNSSGPIVSVPVSALLMSNLIALMLRHIRKITTIIMFIITIMPLTEAIRDIRKNKVLVSYWMSVHQTEHLQLEPF
jgi:hypothetical protein